MKKTLIFLTFWIAMPQSALSEVQDFKDVELLLSEFKGLTSLQQDNWNKDNQWKLWAKGSCKVSDVSKTNVLSEISKSAYEVDCELGSGDRAILFYPKEKHDFLSSLDQGSVIEFEGNLKLIRDWGLWQSAYIKVETNANQEIPQFADYPAINVLSNNAKHSPVKLETDFDLSFKTRIKATEQAPVNFAGEYVLSLWGCGSSCLMGVSVNARTGKVVELPGTICCWNDEGDNVVFRKNSNLLVLAGLINESEPYGAHFYELKNDEFVHLSTIPVESSQ